MTRGERPGRAIVSIWFPNFAIDRWTRIVSRRGEAALADAPTVLVTEGAHGPRIDAANPPAAAIGARAGARLTDARMLDPAIVAVPSDHMGDDATLEKMALAAQRWGPWSAPDRPDAILLDATGSAHLFDGEAAMLAEIEARYAAQGYDARSAIAPTAGAAWALSHYGAAHTVLLDPHAIAAALAPLPVAALRLDDDLIVLLTRLGLKTIGDILSVPRAGLARRFRNRRSADANPLMRIDQLTGRLPEPLVPIIADPPAQADRRLMEPLRHSDLVKRVIGDLAGDLARTLEAKRQGARRLLLLLWRVDGGAIDRRVELASPSRDPAHIAALFDERLDDIDAGLGIDQARLVAIWAEPLVPGQARLDGESEGEGDISRLVDRLVTRLGPQAVRAPRAQASHLPERAQRWTAVETAIGGTAPALQLDLGFHHRPLKLLDRAEAITVIYATPEGLPRRFRWRGGLHDIVRVEGPERIAPEWWRERSSARLRDYYRIEDESGRRYWIYRHGLIGDGRGGIPDWYLHGLFA